MLELDKHYKIFFETCEDFFCITDFDGKFVYVNNICEKILGYTREEILQLSYHELFHPEDANPSVREVRKTITDPKANENRKDHFENRLRHKNGNYIWFSWTGSTSLESKLIYGIGRDITFLKAQQKELLETKEKALEGNKVKCEFMANITHELRTPLNLIQGMATLLSETKLNALQIKYLDILNNSSQTLLQLINDVLDLTKIESGKMNIEPKNTNLFSIFSSLCESTQILCKSKTLKFESNLASDLNNIFLIDPLRLQQVVNNLTSNAIKFTEKGVVTLNAKIENNKLLIQIIDTGIGISEHFKTQLFERFSQANNSLAKYYSGTGLGLSIVKSLIDSMNGTIEVRSDLIHGTIFDVVIPVEISNYSEVSLKTRIIEKTNNKSILLVDDSVDNQFLIKEYLKNENLKLDIANDGLEAIHKCKNNKYDLILMDIQMPKIDGFETTKMIHSNFDGVQDLKIIALSAFTFINDKSKFLKQGFTDALPKPIQKDKLIESIWQHLNQHNSNEDYVINPSMKLGFINRRKNDLIEIEKYLTKNEFDSIKSISHKIAGVSASYGYPELSTLAFRLEDSSKNKNASEIRTIIKEMKHFIYEP